MGVEVQFENTKFMPHMAFEEGFEKTQTGNILRMFFDDLLEL